MDTKQKDQFKKVCIISSLVLIFLISLWFIFQPFFKDEDKQLGINYIIPQADTVTLTDNKLKVYEVGNKLEQERQDMGILSDYFDTETSKEESSHVNKETSSAKIESSILRYKDNNNLIQSFHNSIYEQQVEKMQDRINELQAQLADKETNTFVDDEKRQLEMIEKSYQIATKYLPVNSQQPIYSQTNISKDIDDKKNIKEDTAILNNWIKTKDIVSSLLPISTQNINSFFSVINKDKDVLKNTIKVVVDKTTTLKNGDFVVLRLMEDTQLKGILFPKNSSIYAQARFKDNRMSLNVNSIELNGHIIPIKLTAYDLDGQEGVHISDYENMSSIKDIGANIGNTMGTSFTFSSSTKEQVIAEITRGVMQGANKILQKKLKTVKITIKGGYTLYLIQTK